MGIEPEQDVVLRLPIDGAVKNITVEFGKDEDQLCLTVNAKDAVLVAEGLARSSVVALLWVKPLTKGLGSEQQDAILKRST